MKAAAGPLGAQLKALREAAGFTQEELATIAGLSVHAVSALERGERRRPHVETVRALSAALEARVLGVRDAVAERTGATLTDRTVHGFRVRAEREVRERLGPDRWALAYAAARKISIDALMQEIDRILTKR
jgi:transcriptional regulator with XRE-family HTH domain